ncbi:4-hydroxyphenylacetate 3-hydroxylase N-terminal domain-containing protein [Streptomyces sp. F001]|uniref:4-hydroxyphenylacetate 3-hydroxylase N-terminal domain-containing protein n=1 Tax=Streptomyces sp. F001 TaxID=1510026 RepID=UPI0019D0B9F5|nr:4-hydroxyphenylacetate 3-hydroxylase N-terminal domain-containing protein [Streptomyces sp. F001]
MRTGEQYLESLRDGRVVWVGGERVDDVTTHPLTRAQAQRMAKFYDLHHEPEMQDVMTFVDDDGVRRSMMWFTHTDAAGLRRKRVYLETVVRELDGGSTGRTPCANNYGLITYEEDPQPWSDQSVGTGGRDLTVGIRKFLDQLKEEDWNCAFAFIDPQIDRSKTTRGQERAAHRGDSRRRHRGQRCQSREYRYGRSPTTFTSASSTPGNRERTGHLRRVSGERAGRRDGFPRGDGS